MNRILTNTEHILVSRGDANYDRACDAACRIAEGHMPSVPDFERSDSCIVILFIQHKMYGAGSHHYMFDAWVEKALAEPEEVS